MDAEGLDPRENDEDSVWCNRHCSSNLGDWCGELGGSFLSRLQIYYAPYLYRQEVSKSTFSRFILSLTLTSLGLPPESCSCKNIRTVARPVLRNSGNFHTVTPFREPSRLEPLKALTISTAGFTSVRGTTISSGVQRGPQTPYTPRIVNAKPRSARTQPIPHTNRPENAR